MNRYYILFILLLLFELPASAQVILPERKVDWSLAGLRRTKPSYNNFRNIASFGGSGNGATANDASLQSAISSLAGDSGVIYFPPGNYLFNSPINLRSGIILRGVDASLSTISLSLGGSSHAIYITGSSTSDTSFLTAAGVKDSDVITVDNPAYYQVDSYVKIYQNDTSLINNDYAFNSVGQVLRIREINGNTIRFQSPLRRSYALQFQPRIRRLIMTSGVGIECIKIKRLDSTAFKGANIYMEFAAQCWLTGIESDTTNFAHVQIGSCTNIEVKGSYFHGSFGFGANGKGYGVSGEYSSGECLIENNVFGRLRHAMIFQTGANGNVIGYNFSRGAFRLESAPQNLVGDIVLHGNYPYANLFEGNICENIVIDASHRINGPLNTFFRNRATLYGFLMSPNSGDSTNIVGTEITASGITFGNYIINGAGNFLFGNNHRGTITPAGTTPLPESSYYYTSIPSFWDVNSPWPSIGIPNSLSAGTIPAKARYDAGINYTICSPKMTFTFSGTGDWNNVNNWQGQLPASTTITSGVEVVIDPSTNGECNYTGIINMQKGGKLMVRPGKILNIKSN